MKYKTEITGKGILTDGLRKENILILFEEGTSDIFKEFGAFHPKAELLSPIETGDTIKIGDNVYTVVGVGSEANKNLKEIGHISIHVLNEEEPEAPGVINISGDDLPEIIEGLTIEVE